MSDVKVSSVQPSEASKGMVALFLLGSAAQAKGAIVNIRDGIPYIEGGLTAKDIMLTYIDCLYSVRCGSNTQAYIKNLPD